MTVAELTRSVLTPGPSITTFEPPAPRRWPQWQRIAFRFFSIYLLLQINPWNWLRPIPGVSGVLQYYYRPMRSLVRWSNAHVFHVRETLIPTNGSGDTSFAWAQLWLFVSLAVF